MLFEYYIIKKNPIYFITKKDVYYDVVRFGFPDPYIFLHGNQG